MNIPLVTGVISCAIITGQLADSAVAANFQGGEFNSSPWIVSVH